MKYIFALSSILMLWSCSGSDDAEQEPDVPDPIVVDPEPPAPTTPPTSSTEWNLVWEEEFDSDLSSWNIWEGGAFNNEIQLYQEKNLSIEEGVLTITTTREEVEGVTNPFDDTPKMFAYTSGRIESKELYGPSNTDGAREFRIMSRIQLPKGNGMWPAFWTFGDPWPTLGEIDILEARGNQPMTFQSNIFYGVEEGKPLTKNEDTEKRHQLNVDATNDFHTYELIWKENTLDILFDGVKVHTYTTSPLNFVREMFGNQHKIVLNNAVGGFFFVGVDPNVFTDSATMKVDWVRVYKR